MRAGSALPAADAMAAASATEKEAVMSIRRVIQKIRLATPETMDALESELLKSLEDNAEILGAQHAKLKDESEKAIAVGKKRASQIAEKRAKEEEQSKELRDILKEMGEIIESLDCSVQQLREVVSMEGDLSMSIDDVPAVDSMVQDCAADVQKFDKAVNEVLRGKGKVMLTATVPPEIKSEWTALGERAKKVKSEAQALMMKTRKAMEAVKAEAKKSRFNDIKPRLLENIKETTDKFLKIDEVIQAAEEVVAPYSKAKQGTTEEMLKMGDDALPLVDKAREALAGAQGCLEPPDMDGVDDLKAEIVKFYRDEGKRVQARLGQFSSRIKRATNLISNYKLNVEKIRSNERFEELKPKFAEMIKAAADAGWPELPAFDEMVKAAEASVEPFRTAAKASIEEMQALAETASTAIEEASDGQAQARKALAPFDDSAEEIEDFRIKLKNAFADELREPDERVGKMEMRLDKTKAMLKTFQEAITKRIAARLEEFKSEVKRTLRSYRVKNDMSVEELFAKIDKDSAGAIDESSFLAFLESEELVPEGEAESENRPKLASDDIKSVFAACLPKDEATLSQASFAPMASMFMKATKQTTLTSDFKVTAGKVLRQLKVGEALEILDGPVSDGKVGVKRFKGRALSDGAIGWATMMGNAGTVILKECTADEAEVAAATATAG